MSPFFVNAAAAGLVLAASSGQVTTAPDLPDALELLGKYRAALGSPAGLAAIKNLRCHGKTKWEDLEEHGFVTEVYAGLRKAKITTEFGVWGTYEMGTDGQIVWEKNPLGITIRNDWDACQYMRDFGLMQHVPWQEMYTKARCVGMKDLDGVSCYELQMFPRMLVEADDDVVAQAPPPDIWLLDATTYLPWRINAKSVGMFDEPIELGIGLDDWRAVDGIKYPHRVEIEISGFKPVVTYQSFETNVELPEGFFEPGADVKEAALKSKDPALKARDQEIRIEMQQERHIVSIRVTSKLEDMQKTLGVLLPEAMHHALASGGTITGPPLVRYHNLTDPLDIEAACPVAAPVPAKGRVKAETLPAGEAVVAWHVGPYHQLGATHSRVMEFVKANDLELSGAPWEEYWTDPGLEPDPSKWRTKVIYPIKSATPNKSE